MAGKKRGGGGLLLFVGAIAVVAISMVAGLFYGGTLIADKDDRAASERSSSKAEDFSRKPAADEAKPPGKNAPPSVDERAAKLVSKMSLAEKIGQMMFIGVHGTAMNDDIAFMLNEYKPGGIVLFDRNMETPEQVKKLNRELQKKAREGGARLPLFISVDEEGGDVSRMKEALTPPPSAEEIGKSGKPDEAGRWAEDISVKLREMGFNANFAPVADVGAGDGRSYSKDAKTVADFVRAAAKGYESKKLIYSLKHFPGIGRGVTDTHDDSVSVTATWEELEASDLVPFIELMRRRPAKNYFVMVSHATFDALDPERPASLSRAVITELLRDGIGYDGVVVTDDLEMGAVEKHYGFEEAAVMAVEAGADMLLVCHEYASGEAVYSGVLKAVQSGRLSEERIDESARRIVRMKISHL